MLQQFIPLLCMTFLICLFIVLMQFLWRYLDDLVGKGLSISVVAELFFYAALTMVPTALPLAVLLASLMTFGNLGEKFELTAMKAAGISLIRIMQPLIIFMVMVGIGAFFFQNNVLPYAQTKMWTLLFSMRQKSPEVEIPVKTFYSEIPGMNIFISDKNPVTGMLYDLILYDVSAGFENARIILSDSAKLSFTEDKTHLFLKLHEGEMFENLRDQSMGRNAVKNMPFRRESFPDKEIYIKFDANFNRMDDSVMRNQYVGMNVAQLRTSIDSLNGLVDSLGGIYGTELKAESRFGLNYYRPSAQPGVRATEPVADVKMDHPLNIDSLFTSSPENARMYINAGLSKARQHQQNFEYKTLVLAEEAKLLRRHDAEFQRRFTLSVACLVFFFVGAPLGAIIKKGGLGTPLVISVFLFIVYFIFDNMGAKMARDGKVEVWQGIWLSTMVMLPLGIFLTYKAVGDSAVFNFDAYKGFFDRMRGKGLQRSLSLKEVVITEVVPEKAITMIDEFLADTTDRVAATNSLNTIIDYMSNTRDPAMIMLLNKFPFKVSRKSLPAIVENMHAIRSKLGDSQELKDIDQNAENKA